jgi:predicted RNA-binding Zn ribbon-like protein
MAEAGAHEATFELVGGKLSLDFVNTFDGSRDTGNGREKLTSYADLVSWSRQAGIITNGEAKSLLREAARRPREAAEVLEQAIALRETIYRIFRAVIRGRSPDKADLAALNAALSRALTQSQVIRQGEGFVWDWSYDEDDMDRLLWPVTRSAAELLTSDEFSRARECGGDECTWLFMDTSKNRTRRWCDMKGCGNRAKSRRHYERKKIVNRES